MALQAKLKKMEMVGRRGQGERECVCRGRRDSEDRAWGCRHARRGVSDDREGAGYSDRAFQRHPRPTVVMDVRR